MEGGERVTLYEIFFDVTVSLCERFHGLDPIKLRQYPAHEVIVLMRRTVRYSKNQKKEKKPRKIMKPAPDTWF